MHSAVQSFKSADASLCVQLYTGAKDGKVIAWTCADPSVRLLLSETGPCSSCISAGAVAWQALHQHPPLVKGELASVLRLMRSGVH